MRIPWKKNQTLAHLPNLLKITIFKTIKKWLSRSIITLAKLFWKSPYIYFTPLIIPLKSQHFSKSKSPTELTTDPPLPLTPLFTENWSENLYFMFNSNSNSSSIKVNFLDLFLILIKLFRWWSEGLKGFLPIIQ